MARKIDYRGEGYKRRDKLPAHYSELQAICDAMSHAAQIEMSQAIEQNMPLKREHAYGKWLAYRGLLRVIESGGGRDVAALHTDLTSLERDMLGRVDWKRERFLFPGQEAFPPLEEQHLPGANQP